MATILVVDDDQMLLDMTEELLQFLGHEVFTAKDGAGALNVVSSKGKIFELVILDLSLPDTDGLTLLPKLLAAQPDLKVVLATGSIVNQSKEFLQNQKIAGVLQKPYTFDDLKTLIGKTLQLS